jgi:fructose-1,6-bisphosphatase/inositol monophosphatase family enzyme
VLGSTQKRPIPVQRIREFGQSAIGFCELAMGEVEMFVLARVVGGRFNWDLVLSGATLEEAG